MITTIEQGNLIGQFNAMTGGRNKRQSSQMDKLFEGINSRFPEADPDTVLDYLLKKSEDTGSKKILEIFSFEGFRNFAENDTHEEEKPQEDEKEVEKGTALGALERAICDSVVDTVSPKILDEAKPLIDEFIKTHYQKTVATVEFNFPKRDKKMEGIFHEEFETVLAFVEADEPVLLTGPAGAGKNVICQQVAEAMGLEFYFSNAVTQEYKITGFTDANGNYQPSQFYESFTKGGVFMLDEMDASIPEVLIILNAAIANRYFDFPAPIGKVEAHPDFRIVAGANTFGTGSDSIYSGRYQLDGASLDRFAVVEINYSDKIENSMTNDQELVEFVHKFREACQQTGIRHIVSYRALSRMDKMSHALSKKKVLKTCLLKNLEDDDLRMIWSSYRQEGYNSWQESFRQLV